MATGALWSSARASAASAGRAGASDCAGAAASVALWVLFIEGILDYVYNRAPAYCITGRAPRKWNGVAILRTTPQAARLVAGNCSGRALHRVSSRQRPQQFFRKVEWTQIKDPPDLGTPAYSR